MEVFRCVSAELGRKEDDWLKSVKIVERTPVDDTPAVKLILMGNGSVYAEYYDNRYRDNKMLDAEIKRATGCLLVEYGRLKWKKIPGRNLV